VRFSLSAEASRCLWTKCSSISSFLTQIWVRNGLSVEMENASSCDHVVSMTYIPPSALYNLNKYSYRSVDKSVVSRYVLSPFWNWFVTLWPKWIAPNTVCHFFVRPFHLKFCQITLSGLCIVLCNFATMIYYDPMYLTNKGGAQMPNWIYFTCVCFFQVPYSYHAAGPQACFCINPSMQ
jgi:hypothetical protein